MTSNKFLELRLGDNKISLFPQTSVNDSMSIMKYILPILSLLSLVLASNCPSGWQDASSVDLGCLKFVRENPMSWVEANAFCKSAGSLPHAPSLLEVESSLQMDYLKEELEFLETLVSKIPYRLTKKN